MASKVPPPIKHKGPRGFVYVIVHTDGTNAKKLMDLLEQGQGRNLYSAGTVGNTIHYILQDIPYIPGGNDPNRPPSLMPRS